MTSGGLAFDPQRPPERELEISVRDGFSLAIVGDCMTSRPLAQLRETDPAFGATIEILASATAAVGNVETSILDMRTFGGSPRSAEDWAMVAVPAVAEDLAALELRLVARANNHAMDWGAEGLRETSARLDAAGVVHAGAGETLAAAVAPRYLETPLGRVGLVSVQTTTRTDPTLALDAFGQTPARPGVAGVRLDRLITVSATTFEELRALVRAFDPTGMGLDLTSNRDDASVSLFGSTFVAGDRTSVAYVADAGDVATTVRAVRSGAQHADLLVVSVHCHEEGPDDATPPRALVDLAHLWIDAGAGAVFGHGVHRLWPVELYRGRPILYGMGNFIASDIQEPLTRALYEEARAFDVSPLPTDAEVNGALNAQGFDDQRFFDGVVAEIRYDRGRASLRLHPIDLGYGRSLTESGIPRLATGADATRILARVASMSEPFGVETIVTDGVAAVTGAQPRDDRAVPDGVMADRGAGA